MSVYTPIRTFFSKLRHVFDPNCAILVFHKNRPPCKGDTIAVNGLIAEFK